MDDLEPGSEGAEGAEVPEQLYYEDEVLPEIDLRELVGPQEGSGVQPFNIYSWDEVYANLATLLKNDRKAEALADLHANVVAASSGSEAALGADGDIPILENTRIVREEDGDIADFLESYSQALKKPVYNEQQKALDEVFYPLELAQDADLHPQYWAPRAATTVILGTGTDKAQGVTRVLPSDGRFPLIKNGVARYAPRVSKHQTVAERAAAPSLWDIRDTWKDEAQTQAQGIEAVIQALHSEDVKVASEHVIKVLLDMHGLDWNQIKQDAFQRLVAALEKVDADADTDDSESDGSGSSKKGSKSPNSPKSPKTKWEPERTDIWADLKDHLKRPVATDYMALYDSILQKIPPLPSLPDVPHRDIPSLAQAIANNEVSLKEVVETLRVQKLQRLHDYVRNVMEKYQEGASNGDWEPYAMAAIALATRMEQLRASAANHQGTRSEFVGVYADVAEVKKGNNDALYSGNPTTDDDAATAATYTATTAANALGTSMATAVNDDDILEIEDALASASREGAGDVTVSKGLDKISTLTAAGAVGTAEVLELIVPVVARCAKSAGLVVDIEGLIGFLKPRVLVSSKREQWEAVRPSEATSLDESVVSRLLAVIVDMEACDVLVAGNIAPALLQSKVRAALKTIHNEFVKAAREALALAMGWWVIQLQQAALARALVFDPQAGHIGFMDSWDPFGPPLEISSTSASGSRKKAAATAPNRGVLIYLSKVMLDIGLPAGERAAMLPYADANSLCEAVLKKIKESLAREVSELKERYIQFQHELGTISDKARLAEQSLIESVRQKASRPTVVSKYASTLILLPGLMGSSEKIVASGASFGCCYQQLSPSFTADSDWRPKNKTLQKLKDVFAEQRVIPPVRKALLRRTKEAAATGTDTEVVPAPPRAEPVVQAAAAPPVALPKADLSEWLSKRLGQASLALLPVGLIAEMRNDSKSTVPFIKRYTALATTSIGKKWDTLDTDIVASELTLEEQLGLLTSVARSLWGMTSVYRDTSSREHQALKDAIKAISDFQAAWNTGMSGVIDEIDTAAAKRILGFVLARAICLPADPERSKTSIGLPYAVHEGFMKNTTTRILKDLQAALTARKMPTVEEQQEYITMKREQQKSEILAELDILGVEEREALLQARKLSLIAKKKYGVSGNGNGDGDGVGEGDGEAYGAGGDDYGEEADMPAGMMGEEPGDMDDSDLL